MKNKVLVHLYVPAIDYGFDIFIPVNDSIEHVMQMLLKSVIELADINLNPNNKHYLLDPDTGIIYADSQIIRDTDIRNHKKIILI